MAAATSVAAQSAAAAGRAIDAAALSKLRWRCRRGLLENDLLIERLFTRAAPLTQAEANGLYLLMELGDNDLLDLFLGRQKPTANLDRPEVHQVLEAVRAQGTRPDPSLSSATSY
jgi:antitoxin CptB